MEKQDKEKEVEERKEDEVKTDVESKAEEVEVSGGHQCTPAEEEHVTVVSCTPPEYTVREEERIEVVEEEEEKAKREVEEQEADAESGSSMSTLSLPSRSSCSFTAPSLFISLALSTS